MSAAGVALVVLWKIIKEFNVVGQPHPHMGSLEQIMAQHPPLRESLRQQPAEGMDVVNSLALVGAFAAQVLVDIGNRLGIGIDTDGIGKQTAEDRSIGAFQGRTHSRLDDGIRAGDDAPPRIEARLVERVGQGFDESAGCAVRQLGVAVEGDDKADVGQSLPVADSDQGAGRLGSCPVNQAVELLQFAPLAFPADESLLGRAPAAGPVKQKKPLAAMAAVELCNECGCGLKQVNISLAGGRRRVGIVGEQAEKKIRVLVGKGADFQFLHLRMNRVDIHQHHRYDHQSAEGIGDSLVLEIHFRQGSRRQQSRNQVVDYFDRQLADRDQQQQYQTGNKQSGLSGDRAAGEQGEERNRYRQQQGKGADGE